jgi:predicted RNase H-like HicB family nuclease
VSFGKTPESTMKKITIAVALVAVAYGAFAFSAGKSASSNVAKASETYQSRMQQIEDAAK